MMMTTLNNTIILLVLLVLTVFQSLVYIVGIMVFLPFSLVAVYIIPTIGRIYDKNHKTINTLLWRLSRKKG